MCVQFSLLGCRTSANCVRTALAFPHSTFAMCFSCRTTSKASYLAYRRDRDRGLPTFEGSYKRTMSPSEQDVIGATQSVSTGNFTFRYELYWKNCGVLEMYRESVGCVWLAQGMFTWQACVKRWRTLESMNGGDFRGECVCLFCGDFNEYVRNG
jgi:hypothetical protein